MRRMSSALRDWLITLWLVGPATLTLTLFVFLPLAVVALLSFTDYTFGAPKIQWIGLDNYAALFGSGSGRRALVNTLTYVALVLPLSTGLGLAAAVGLHGLAARAPRMTALLKAIYFLPMAATLVAMSVSWRMVLHPTFGVVNLLLDALGGTGQNWLGDRAIVLFTLSAIGVWHSVGYTMVLFLAGLTAIPEVLYDAAEVDGAGSGWSRFWTVTWPMLGPTTLFVMVVSAANAFRVFDTVATLTKGGPAFASDTLVYALYREGFVYFKVGYSSSIAMALFFCLLLLTLAQFFLAEKKVHYR